MTEQLQGVAVAPLYVRLKEALRRDIAAQMKAGDLIPSERALIDRYGVSRTTVRLALTALANEGLIIRKQGRGSFVSAPKEVAAHSGAFLTREPRQDSNAVLISVEEIEADTRTAPQMLVDEGTVVCRIRWAETSNGVRKAYHVSYLPRSVGGKALRSATSLTELRAVLAEYQTRAVEGDRVVEVVLADPFRASMLNVSEGVPLLLVESVATDDEGIPLELSRAFYPGHAVRLQLKNMSQRGTELLNNV